MKKTFTRRLIAGCSAVAVLFGMNPSALKEVSTAFVYAQENDAEAPVLITSSAIAFNLSGGSYTGNEYDVTGDLCRLKAGTESAGVPVPEPPVNSNLVFMGWTAADGTLTDEFEENSTYYAQWKYGSDSETNPYSRLLYNIYSGGRFFDLKGNGGSFRTTYSNGGYDLFFLSSGSKRQYNSAGNGGAASVACGDGIFVTPVVSFCNFSGEQSENEEENKFVKIDYLIQNRTSETVTNAAVASTCDVMIGGNDRAEIRGYASDGTRVTADNKESFSYVTGIEMYENTTNVFSINLSDGGDCWWGHYGSRHDYAFAGHLSSNYGTGYDSGISYCWKDITIEPGQTVKKTAVFTAGDIHFFRTHNYDADGICYGGSGCGLEVDHTEQTPEFLQPALYEAGVYQVRNAGQLMWLSDKINSEVLPSDVSVKLMHDITVPAGYGEKWVPVSVFSGSFDGNGHTVCGINTLESENGGLFGVLDGASVHDLGITDSVFAGGAEAVGSLAAEARNNTQIRNVYSTANVSGSKSAGIVYTVDGSVVASSYYAGGTESDVAGEVKGAGRVTDSFFLSENASADAQTAATAISAAQFADGSAAYVLGQGWHQTLGADEFPVLTGEDTVYRYTKNLSCSNTDPQPQLIYTNDQTLSGQVIRKEHTLVTGPVTKRPTCTTNAFAKKVCSECGYVSNETVELTGEGNEATGHNHGTDGYCTNTDPNTGIRCRDFDPQAVVTTVTTTVTTVTTTVTTTPAPVTTVTSAATTVTGSSVPVTTTRRPAVTTVTTSPSVPAVTTPVTTEEPFRPVTTEYVPDLEEIIEEEAPRRLNIVGELTAKPMTLDEIVSAGIDVSDPENYHVVKYSVELQFEAEIVAFNKIVTPDGTLISVGSSSGSHYIPVGKPVYFEELDASVGYYQLEHQEMFIIIYGECKWLKEFYDVQLVVFNSDTATLHDCSTVLNVPDGLTLCNSQQTQNIGDLVPGAVADVHWYLRGDKPGDYSLMALFRGTNGGEEFEYEFRSRNDIHVYAGNQLKMTVEACRYSFYDKPYDITVRLTNVSDKPIYKFENRITKVEHGFYSYGIIKEDGTYTFYKDRTVLSSGGGTTVKTDVLNPGESAVIVITVNDIWKSPLERYLEDSKTAVDVYKLLLSLSGMKVSSFFAGAVSNIIADIDVAHVLDTVIVSTLEGSTTRIPFELVVTDLSSGEKKRHEFHPVRDIARANDYIDQAFNAFELVYENSEAMQEDIEAVRNGEMTEDEFLNRYYNIWERYQYSQAKFALGKLIADDYVSGVVMDSITVGEDIYNYYIVKPEGNISARAYITDRNGNIISPSSPAAPGHLYRSAAPAVTSAALMPYELSVVNGEYTCENGIYDLSGNAVLALKANTADEIAVIHIDYSDGETVEYPVVSFPEHECTGGMYRLISAPSSDRYGCMIQTCETCSAVVDTKLVDYRSTAVLSDGRAFYSVYDAAEAARRDAESGKEFEMSCFGNVVIDSNLEIPENVKFIVTPYAEVTFKNDSVILAAGETLNLSESEVPFSEGFIFNLYDGKQQVVYKNTGEVLTAADLPQLSEACGFDGWYTDEECTVPFEEITVGEDGYSNVFYSKTEHSFASAGMCRVCGNVRNGLDRFVSANVAVGGEFKLNFNVFLTEKALSYRNSFMQFTRADGTTEKHYVKDAEVNSDGSLRFTCSVFADRLDEMITAQVMYSPNVQGTSYTYSIEKYMNYIIGNPSRYTEETVESIKALLNFSGYVQKYTGVNAESPVNRDLDMALDDVAVDISDDYRAQITDSSDSVDFKYAGLYLNSLAGLRFRFSVSDISNYAVTVDGREVTPVMTGDGLYTVKIDGIAPDDYDRMYVLKIQSKTDENDFAQIAYSCLTYARTIISGDYDADITNVMKAMYFYNKAIENYISSK